MAVSFTIVLYPCRCCSGSASELLRRRQTHANARNLRVCLLHGKDVDELILAVDSGPGRSLNPVPQVLVEIAAHGAGHDGQGPAAPSPGLVAPPVAQHGAGATAAVVWVRHEHPKVQLLTSTMREVVAKGTRHGGRVGSHMAAVGVVPLIDAAI
jgi:hypothetical protein